jgi:hypothetical protein
MTHDVTEQKVALGKVKETSDQQIVQLRETMANFSKQAKVAHQESVAKVLELEKQIEEHKAAFKAMLESKAKELSLYGERLVRNLSTALSK